ncbi:host specificity J domain protein, partial [Escherichia coli EC1856]
ARSCWKKSI